MFDLLLCRGGSGLEGGDDESLCFGDGTVVQRFSVMNRMSFRDLDFYACMRQSIKDKSLNAREKVYSVHLFRSKKFNG